MDMLLIYIQCTVDKNNNNDKNRVAVYLFAPYHTRVFNILRI